jgi:hypothetical protein
LLPRRWSEGLDVRRIVCEIRARGGRPDVAERQPKMARAEVLVFIAPCILEDYCQ